MGLGAHFVQYLSSRAPHVMEQRVRGDEDELYIWAKRKRKNRERRRLLVDYFIERARLFLGLYNTVGARSVVNILHEKRSHSIKCVLLFTWIYHLRFLFILSPFLELVRHSTVRMERASVVTGRTAELPCDITPPPLDSLYLVLCYKNDSDFPIYK